ncbi:MAG: hypothetical protein M4D85_00180 [Actinomycetota bacterium]|nr:hypothetical protein [Actinomycetota bacterium]MDQ3663656.1 hypothetical protein [Actinomycetota bacterium]
MTSALPDEVTTADRVALAVVSVPGVAELHPGRYGEVATHLPGRRVRGIQLRSDRVEVHVALHWGTDVLATADEVRAAAMRVADRPVDVTVEDVFAPGAGGGDEMSPQ